ncbi:MAG: hypothetical protein GVY18_05180 [Bacteroidetes bacterium]|jgi:hypothetical protein|nr:hypothetical protein [Bacteroidota bacterium]
MIYAAIIAGLGLLCYLGNAVQSAGHYSGKGIGPDAIHPGQLLLNTSIGLLTWGGLWGWTTDPYASACIGGAMVSVGSVVFQGYINLDYGRPFIDPQERNGYDLFGHTVPKLFARRRRYLQLVLAAGLLVLAYFRPWG